MTTAGEGYGGAGAAGQAERQTISREDASVEAAPGELLATVRDGSLARRGLGAGDELLLDVHAPIRQGGLAVAELARAGPDDPPRPAVVGVAWFTEDGSVVLLSDTDEPLPGGPVLCVCIAEDGPAPVVAAIAVRHKGWRPCPRPSVPVTLPVPN